MVETVSNQDSSQSVTWEDVIAVAKVCGVKVEKVTRLQQHTPQMYCIHNKHGLFTYYADPKSAMDEVVLVSKQPEMTWTMTAEL